MITFINELDIREVYQFVNFFPFLIDPDELFKIEQEEREEREKYTLQEPVMYRQDSEDS